MGQVSPAVEVNATLLYRWFVLYNPLYFFSALCVLAACACWPGTCPD